MQLVPLVVHHPACLVRAPPPFTPVLCALHEPIICAPACAHAACRGCGPRVDCRWSLLEAYLQPRAAGAATTRTTSAAAPLPLAASMRLLVSGELYKWWEFWCLSHGLPLVHVMNTGGAGSATSDHAYVLTRCMRCSRVCNACARVRHRVDARRVYAQRVCVTHAACVQCVRSRAGGSREE